MTKQTIPKSQTLAFNGRFPTTHLLVLAAYLLLTILMTWPTVLHLTGGIPGDGFDGWQNYWNLWWVKRALLIEGSNPFFTTYLDAPTGVSLLFHTLNIFNGLWTLPIQLNFGLAVAYNSVVFVSFGLAGYGGYLLSLYVLAKIFPAGRGLRAAAFVGGLVFTMSPFHMAHLLGHMQVFSMIWPPFYVLWLLRTLQPWSPRLDPPLRWRDAAISTLFLILASLVAWYHTLYLLIFTGLTLLWTLWQRWKVGQGHRVAKEQGGRGAGAQGRRGAEAQGSNYVPRTTPHASRLTPHASLTPALRAGASVTPHSSLITPHSSLLTILRPLWIVLFIGLGFTLFLSPLLIPMVRDAGSRPDLETGLVQNITLSADLLAYVLPSEMHPLWGNWAKRIADNFSTTTSERLIFAGFVPLALAAFVAVKKWANAIVKFWLLVTAAYVVLSLGPYLHVGGQIVSIGAWPIPMPYLLLYHTIPFIDLTRSLSRYNLMVMLGLGILVSIALVPITNYQLQKHATHNASHSSLLTPHSSLLIPFLATALILFEFLPIPYPISKIDTPQFYYEIAGQPDDFIIAELPMNWDRPTPLLHQTVHGKPLLTAYTSRANPRMLAWRTPVLQHWRNLGPDIIDQPLAQIAPTIFFDFNLRYIVLDYWQMPPGPERTATERWVAVALPGVDPIYDDGRLKVYQTPPKQETQPYLSLGQGWGKRQPHHDEPVTRSILPNRQPALFLHHPQNLPLTLEITAATSQTGKQTVTIFANDRPIDSVQIAQTFTNHAIPLPPLAGSPVKIQLIPQNPGATIVVSRVGLRR